MIKNELANDGRLASAGRSTFRPASAGRPSPASSLWGGRFGRNMIQIGHHARVGDNKVRAVDLNLTHLRTLLDLWAEQIATGVLSALASMPDEPFADVGLVFGGRR